MNKQKQIIDDRLEAWLAAAPKPAASPEFCTRVMRAIEARPLPWRVRLYRFLFVPHTLNWNIAGAGGAAFVLVVGLGLGLTVLDRADGPLSTTAMAPTAAAKVTVRFEVNLPQAQQVQLAGDFTQWQARVVLRRQPNGIWVAEVPLPPGEHEYMFVVDGNRWLADPRAARYRDDGFGSRNAVVAVPSA